MDASPVQHYLQPLSTGEIIAGAFRVYRDHLMLLVLVALFPHLALLGFEVLLLVPGAPDPRIFFLFLGATVVVNGVTLTAITQAVTRSLLGGEPTVAEVYRHTFTRPLWSAIAAYLVTALLISTGIMFLILPGIFLGGVLSVTIPIIVVEQRRTVRAMAGSISLLREELVKGMIVFCFFMLVAGLLPLMFLLLQGGAGVGPFTPLLGAIVGAVTLPLGFTAHVLLYLSLRAKSGYTSAALEADLNPPPAE